jgi:DNA polymerase V
MTIFSLVDCNNFYVSCERAFNPTLEGRPVIVLSNNDGCVIARSNEAKALGISMGEPYFKCREQCEKNNIAVFSSNYELYGDMSQRVMSVLQEFCPEIEIYSIDEAFLSFSSFNHYDLTEYVKTIRAAVKSYTGIPVSIGLAPTKTLAKIANSIAKQNTSDGVFDLCPETIRASTLNQFPVEKIWGIGRRINARLAYFNIKTADDLRKMDAKLMRREFSVVMEKMIAELNGISCLPLEEVQPPKKQIMSSRSFSHPVISLTDLEEAVSTYTSRAAFKLREQKSIACGIHVFVETNFFRPDQKQYGNTYSYHFTLPTNDTRTLIKHAKTGLKKIFKPGFKYKKAGVMLLDIMPLDFEQFDILTAETNQKNQLVMNTLDKINARFGKQSLFVGAEGTVQNWQMKRKLMSPRCTTHWKELIKVKCG